ncbi:amidohydrolase [Crateriforma spongiae]|uniref:amidohydrolase n=1 Tax=Crateriforma spongiae TaxID=2724528 RepID=UPI0014466FFE|nr:amidohydrolase [Crateriforma spongiae]
MFRLVLLASVLALSPLTATAAEIVRYRCVEWKAKHIHEKKKADTIAETLKKLKCEVKRHAHGDHEDVQYRCPKWQALNLKTHDEAHKWEKWLKEYGFQTEHKH